MTTKKGTQLPKPPLVTVSTTVEHVINIDQEFVEQIIADYCTEHYGDGFTVKSDHVQFDNLYEGSNADVRITWSKQA